MIAPAPNLADRLLSAGCYMGGAPFTRGFRAGSASAFLQHHFSQALAGFFLMVIVFAGACAWEGVECLIAIKFPRLEADRGLGFIFSALDYLEFFLLLAFLPLFAMLVGLALSGSTWKVPLLARLTRKRWPLRVAFILNSSALLAIPFIAIFAFWSLSLTQRSSEDAKVYFLYDDGIPVPRWGYAMGLSRLALQAQRNWGKQSTVLDRLTKETLRTALGSGKVLILATHGEDGYAATYYAPEVLGIWPADSGAMDGTASPRFLRLSVRGADNKWSKSENVGVNSQLQLAYIFACHAGKRAAQWQEHLAPARVVTYNRFSTVWDHAVWFAFTGPSELKQVR